VASLSQGRTAAAQCGLFTHKSVPVIFEPPCIIWFTQNESICSSLWDPNIFLSSSWVYRSFTLNLETTFRDHTKQEVKLCFVILHYCLF